MCTRIESGHTMWPSTNHIAHKTVFELRPPLPTTTFELLLLQTSSPYIFGDMSQHVHGWPVLKFYSKRNKTLLRTLHTCRLWKYVAPPTESMSKMAAKTLSICRHFDRKEWQDKHFWRSLVHKINKRNGWLRFFLFFACFMLWHAQHLHND